MPTRDEMIAALKAKDAGAIKPTRGQMISALKQKDTGESDGSGGGIMDTVIKGAQAIDSVGGAPTRAAIYAAQEGKNPISAFASQFGEDPGLAPSGEKIVQRAGVSSPTAAKVLGFGVDLVADPLNLVPIGKVASLGARGASAGVKTVAKGAGAVADVAAQGARRLPGAKTVGTTVNIIGVGASNTAEALKKMFTPSQADDWKSLKAIAKKNNIDPRILPESVEFGEGSFISRAARNRAEGVLGESHLKRFQEGLDAVQEATENKIAKISGGRVPEPIEAGTLIRQGYDAGVDNLFNSVGMTHNKVIEAIPGLSLSGSALKNLESKLSGLEKWAKGRMERGFTNAQRAQGEQLLRAVEAVKNSAVSKRTLVKGSKYSKWVPEEAQTYKRMVETLRDIGDVAFKSQNVLADIPPDIAKFRELYGTINDALVDTVRQAAGAPVADELIASNKLIHEFLGDKSVISGVVGNKQLGPEKVFKALVEQGDSRKIQALKKILPPETFKQLKGSFLASQIRKNADDSFTFKSLHNNLRNKKAVLGELLDANEIEELSELIRLGDRFGNPVLSTSGTGASGLFSDIAKGIRSGVESDTVIGQLKESARKRSARAAKQVESARSAAPKPKARAILPAASEKTKNNLKRIAMVSPAILRALSIEKESEQDVRGDKKWSVDGIANIIDHDKNFDVSRLEELAKSPKGRSILISASDLKPGSMAMKKLLEKTKGK